MDNHFKESAWAFLAYGTLSLLVLLNLYFFFLENFADGSMFELFASLLIGLFAIVSLLMIYTGLQLLKGQPKAHKLALPIAIITLLHVPVGSIVGGIYLWQRNKYIS